ncbi:carboxymuconolactone decarboxylase family protein [Nocardioides sp. SYSU D00038]|uniref:carboxymuconolactone decarboxylase family protein n=1 Tax=Nocardioides sp. SYSU D00038 TaxID=2812554 RepID=UPI0019679D61|nr:carboxymuconolactone decarboxylase family protein [Nocardioides sp. SYSU D00038]
MSTGGTIASLGRVPWTSAGPLTEDQQHLATTIRADWSDAGLGVGPVDDAGRLSGPFDLMVASPRVGRAVLELAGSFRQGLLSPVERETVVLVVAAHDRCGYMWAGHLPLARRVGLADDLALALRDGAPLPHDAPRVAALARELCRTGDVEDEHFERAVEQLGWPRVQEAVWLVGLYRALALAMRVARVTDPHEAGEQ